MKVRVIRKFYDAKTKKPYKLRLPGDIYSPQDSRAKELTRAYFVVPLEEPIEQPTATPETETKDDND